MVAEAVDLRLGDRDRAIVRLGKWAEQAPEAERHSSRDAADLHGRAPLAEATTVVELGEASAREIVRGLLARPLKAEGQAG